MRRHLVWSFRLLTPMFHGRGDGGEPEWPPSPLRAFQAVVAATARAGRLEEVGPLLEWLERRPAPRILAPTVQPTRGAYRLSVPHNQMDEVAKQWVRGEEGSGAIHRTMKDVRPIYLRSDAPVSYLWELDADTPNLDALHEVVRGVVALGWGVDLVVGDARVIDGECSTECSRGLVCWVPRHDGDEVRRTPRTGTLGALRRRHEAFLARVGSEEGVIFPTPPLDIYATVPYASSAQLSKPSTAEFLLVHPTTDRFATFDSARRSKVVAGMVRHALKRAAESAGWSAERVASTVLGHGESGDPRFLIIPAPSIESRGPSREVVGPVRRVLLISTDPTGRDTSWARRALGGMDLIDEDTGEVKAVLAAVTNDKVLSRYLRPSRVWTTVTPLILPGFDEPGRSRSSTSEARSKRLLERRDNLVRKAMRHAGVQSSLVKSAVIETSPTGFIAGVDLASRYHLPSHLASSPRVHVKVTWPIRIKGPLCLGSGRFSGMGLFVSVD